jgi:hypothetical protein
LASASELYNIRALNRGSGEIGRHTGFRFQRFTA